MLGTQEKQTLEYVQSVKARTGIKKGGLTQKKVKELFRYEDGNLIRRKATCNCTKVGDIAGSLGYNGYVITMIDRKTYYNHRLIWLFHNGYFPENDIDHIDRNKSNNRIENLREVSRTCNSKNTGNRSTNRSGVKGVSWSKDCNKWMVRITVNYKDHYIGVFESFAEAVYHRLAVEQCLGWDGCDLNSPAYEYINNTIT